MIAPLRQRQTFRHRLLNQVSVHALHVTGQRPVVGLLAAGLIGAPAPALAQEVIAATEADVILQGAEGSGVGRAVSGAGDINGDSIDDLIVGAPSANPDGRDRAGASYVIFGSDQGLPAVIDLATDADVTIWGAGSSVSGAGDVNGDGFDDLLIGAGASYVVFGTAQGFPATIDLATDADVTIWGAGFSVSGAGDVDGDGIDDLIVGAPSANPDGRDRAGASYVIFGSDQGLPTVIDLATDADVTIWGATAFDNSGFSVSGAGDIDGDGIDDLIVGAPAVYAGGASYVILGSDQGLPAIIDLATDADVVVQGVGGYDDSGFSVSGAGDVDGDGIDDLIIGEGGAEFVDAGRSVVIFGSDQGLPATIDLATDADLILQGIESQDGDVDPSVSGAGDVSGDGIDDLIIGARWTDVNGQSYAGAGYVVFGDRNLPAVVDLAEAADLIIQGVNEYDLVGNSVSGAGDVNGDGIDDVIVGALLDGGPGGSDSGGAGYVVFGGPEAALGRLIARVEAAGLGDGLGNSLTKSLEGALRLLARNNTIGAVRQVGSFIDQVEAQEGKKIDAADADAWIAAAETILDMVRAS